VAGLVAVDAADASDALLLSVMVARPDALCPARLLLPSMLSVK
jgi:hypothetical protein